MLIRMPEKGEVHMDLDIDGQSLGLTVYFSKADVQLEGKEDAIISYLLKI